MMADFLSFFLLLFSSLAAHGAILESVRYVAFSGRVILGSDCSAILGTRVLSEQIYPNKMV